MRKNNVIFPAVAEEVVKKAIREGKIHVERVGKIMDGGFSIAEKLIVFWLDTGVAVFRTKVQKIGDFPVLNYVMEKYPAEKSDGIIAEIIRLRKEYTSGVI